MSAIAGIFLEEEKPVNRCDILAMLSAMRHRGPHRTGAWCAGSAGMGHALLSTTPSSLGESLPLWDPLRQLVVTADVRLDNRGELLAVLQIGRDPPCETPDSELILRAYRRWGERCPEKLLGDFAFAIWDQQRRTLFCARDHFGVKPFYYLCSNQGFFFASEIKALLSLSQVPRLLNELRIAQFLAADLQDTSITFYQDILRLSPAHSLTLRRGAVRLHRYWSLDPAREIPHRSDQEYAEEFRSIFMDAVRVRLPSASRVGSLLSGGLDSSSVVCAARQILAENPGSELHSFSAVFRDVPESDESPYIYSVFDGGGIEAEFVESGNISPLHDLPAMLACQDQPFYAPNLFLHWALYRAANRQNVHVLFDGLDGDLTVSHGIGILPELLLKGRWISLAREIRGLSRNFQIPVWCLLRARVLRPLIPQSIWRMRQAIRDNRSNAVGLRPPLNPEFARRIGWKPLEYTNPQLPRTARGEHVFGLTRGLIPYVLEVADHAAKSFSIEPRYPFFDKRLVEYCLALPAEQRIFRGWTRMVMRRAMTGILPEKIQWRGGKADLGVNFFRSLLACESKLIEEMLRNPALAIWQYADHQALDRTYKQSLSTESKRSVLSLWQAATLQTWLQQADSRRTLVPRNELNEISKGDQMSPRTVAARTAHS